MFKPKTPISGRLDNSNGGWIRLYPKGANQRPPPLLGVLREVMSSNQLSLTLDLQAIHIGYTC